MRALAKVPQHVILLLMMQMPARIALVLTLLAVMLSGCEHASTTRGPITPSQPLRVVATIKPLELIANDLLDASLGELVDITVLMPSDVSPHGFEPTPGQMARLKQADIVLYNGLGLDDWAVRDLPRGTVALRFADVLGHEADHVHHHHDHDHAECDHDHGPVDEHLWLDVSLVEDFAGIIAAEFGRHLGGNAHEALQTSLTTFIAAGHEIDDAFAVALAPHVGRPLVTHHNVFSRLATRYTLGEAIVLRPVEMLEPTPGDLRRAIEAIRDNEVTFILVEPQFNPTAAQRIADETNVTLIEVDPLGGEADSWAQMMQNLLSAMLQGLQSSS